MKYADQLLDESAAGVGYNPTERLKLQNEVHQRFVVHLKTLLTHRDTREKFAPFLAFIEAGTGERTAIAALMEHAAYQRALYHETPVFGKEVFALSHIYVDTECGKLTWGEIRDSSQQRGERVDPFLEKWGGRQRLGETVLGLLGDPKFRDAIVIQGVAGSGKSAFTQWLSAELVRQGLRPIRVQLRHIRLERNRPVAEALAEALRYRDESQNDPLAYPPPDDPFNGNAIFKEWVRFRSSDICPYVLILDGWDEISISVSEGFKVRLNRMLEQLRSEFLSNRGVLVRVILTGRPSAEVADSPFLHKSTPILTLRPFAPADLKTFFSKVAEAVTNPPLHGVEGTHWPSVDASRFDPVVEEYSDSNSKNLEILGLPLLALLAARLLSHAKPEDAQSVIENRTTLYRNLVDLTCGAAGKYIDSGEQREQQFHLAGSQLRDLLHRTAVAMTVYGKENIPYDELELRLDLEQKLSERVDDDTRDNPLSQLMVSYYFKGGHEDLGCEFLHKSFREYLFAEGVVELLKRYGRSVTSVLPERPLYWKDFEQTDPRYQLSRDFAMAVSAQWLRSEVVSFLEELLAWEIARAAKPDEPLIASAKPTDPLTLEQWEVVRDALADLWDWWGEGVHLRPQPAISRQKTAVFDNVTFAQELVEHVIPMARARGHVPEPARIVTVDAHLGEALFRVTAVTHFRIAVARGWLDFGGSEPIPAELWRETNGGTPRRYQAGVQREERHWVLFAPSKPEPNYWQIYVARINAAGWRANGPFPGGCDMQGIDLSSADIAILFGYGAGIDWSYSNLADAYAAGGEFTSHVFRYALLTRSKFPLAALQGAVFDGADAATLSLPQLKI